MNTFFIRNQEFTKWAKSYTGPRFHALFADPPYGLAFMGMDWDSPGGPAAYQAEAKTWGEAMLPLLYPGALVFMFGGTRTSHRLACGMEDAGFETVDTLMWLHAEGFPKSQDIGKLIDRKKRNGRKAKGKQIFGRHKRHSAVLTVPTSAESAAWSGYKTPALKPAYEPILVFRAPRGAMTYAELGTTYGTGCLNIDGGRIGSETISTHNAPAGTFAGGERGRGSDTNSYQQRCGRYPANVLLDEESAKLLDEQSGVSKSGANRKERGTGGIWEEGNGIPCGPQYGDSGGASRFFYVAKASKRERNAGCDGDTQPFETNQPYGKGAAARKEGNASGSRNNHPTVKPLALCKYLATLLLPPAPVAPRRLLVPFAGSGSEMIGALLAGWEEVIGVERDANYCKIAEKRLAFHQQDSAAKPLVNGVEVLSTSLYSGRKSWFVRHAAKYFRAHPCQTLVEPFAGSAVVGLSLLYAGIIERLILVEKDERIVCLLNGLLHDPELADRYAKFSCTRANVERLLRDEKTAFRYLVQSRCSNRGKFDGGLRTAIDSRWCRDLVVGNIRRVHAMRDRIEVINDDGLEVMRQYADDPNVGCFADPMYTADVKSKGHTVYLHGKLNHQKLFSLLSRWRGPSLMTQDNSRMVRNLALSYRFSSKPVRMVTAENKRKNELVLWRKRRIF